MRPERAARGPKPAYSRAEVAAVGVRVADAEGIEAVSMRRIAAELGAGTTSLYRYVSKKDDILDLMGDAIMGEEDPPARTGDWRADLREIARRTRAVMLRHPWSAALSAGRPSLGPNGLRWMEASFAALGDLGLDADDLLAKVSAVATYVRGTVAGELGEREAARRSGLTIDGWMAEQSPYGKVIRDSGRYPTFTRIMEEARIPHLPDRLERLFALGLEQVLDGLAASLGNPRRGGGHPHGAGSQP